MHFSHLGPWYSFYQDSGLPFTNSTPFLPLYTHLTLPRTTTAFIKQTIRCIIDISPCSRYWQVQDQSASKFCDDWGFSSQLAAVHFFVVFLGGRERVCLGASRCEGTDLMMRRTSSQWTSHLPKTPPFMSCFGVTACLSLPMRLWGVNKVGSSMWELRDARTLVGGDGAST